MADDEDDGTEAEDDDEEEKEEFDGDREMDFEDEGLRRGASLLSEVLRRWKDFAERLRRLVKVLGFFKAA